jgi:hypothetical protein
MKRGRHSVLIVSAVPPTLHRRRAQPLTNTRHEASQASTPLTALVADHLSGTLVTPSRTPNHASQPPERLRMADFFVIRRRGQES